MHVVIGMILRCERRERRERRERADPEGTTGKNRPLGPQTRLRSAAQPRSTHTRIDHKGRDVHISAVRDASGVFLHEMGRLESLLALAQWLQGQKGAAAALHLQ